MNLDQFKAFAQKLEALRDADQIGEHSEEMQGPAYRRAMERLQRAVAEFGRDTSNLIKLDAMLNAMDHYQTASEMLRIRLRSRLEQLNTAQRNNS